MSTAEIIPFPASAAQAGLPLLIARLTAYAQEHGLPEPKRSGDEWLACCPAHDDREPSLAVTERGGRPLMNDFGGCAPGRILLALDMTWGDFLGSSTPTTTDFCAARELNETLCHECGWEDGPKGIHIPYRDTDGRTVAVQTRERWSGDKKLKWRKGDHALPYGLWRLTDAAKQGYLLVVEGPTDAITCWPLGYPALGLPGAQSQRCLDPYIPLLGEVPEVFVAAEVDQAGDGFPGRVAERLRRGGYTGTIRRLAMPVSLGDHADINEMWTACVRQGEQETRGVRWRADPPEVHAEALKRARMIFDQRMAEMMDAAQEVVVPDADLGGYDSPLRAEADGYHNGDRRISSFTLRVLRRLLLPDGTEEWRLSVKYADGTEREVRATDQSLLDARALLSLVGMRGSWWGSAQDLQHLRDLLTHQSAPVRQGVSVIGRHEHEGTAYLVTPGGTWGASGRIDDPPVTYVASGAPMEPGIRLEPPDDWTTLARRVTELLPRVHDRRAALAITGWMLAATVAPVIRARWRHMPILQVWGSFESGKTTLVRTLWRVTGASTDPFAAGTTRFSYLRLLSGTNAIPVVFDEWRRDLERDPNLPRYLRMAYDGMTETRGQKTGGVTMYPLVAPPAVLGEDPFQDTALATRTVMVTLDRNVLRSNEHVRKAYSELDALPLEQFAGGWAAWVLGRELAPILAAARAAAGEAVAGVGARERDNLATVALRLLLAEDLATEVGAEVPCDHAGLIDLLQWLHEHADGRDVRPKDPLARVVERWATMAQTRGLRRGTHFSYDPTKEELLVHLSATLAADAEWRAKRRMTDEQVSDDAVRRYLKENADAKGYVNDAHAKRRVGGAPSWCAVIDAKRLDAEVGIDPEVWNRRDQWGDKRGSAADDDAAPEPEEAVDF